MFDLLYAWPGALPRLAQCSSTVQKAAVLLRLQRFRDAEAEILAALGVQAAHVLADLLTLRALCSIELRQFDGAAAVVEALVQLGDCCPDEQRRWIQARYWIKSGQFALLQQQTDTFWQCQICWPLALNHVDWLVGLGELDHAIRALDALPAPFHQCLEALLFRASILERRGRADLALEMLLPVVQRFPQHWRLRRYLLHLTVEARSHQHAMPVFRKALERFAKEPEIYGHIANIEMLRNNVAAARRSSLGDRAWTVTRFVQSSPLGNLLNCYDRLGSPEWLFNAVPSLDSRYFPLVMRENAVMQFCSVANSGHAQRIRAQVESVLAEYQQPVASPSRFSPHLRRDRTLRIGWVTGDVAYHPVARFVYGLFASAPDRAHQHLLIDVNDHQQESSRGLFDGLPNLQVKVVNQRDHAAAVDAIRAMELDLAIDLSGWTGGHFMRGFHQRLAPTQVNYLGYFATAGIPAMDVWLGDRALFPEVVSEWHTEVLHRLNRCFIAWQPPSPLPEADVEVVEAASMAGGLRFGSFNHNRKLSDRTLVLWGELLRSVPGSSLVLKASNRDDSSTQELLSRRMRRCGLDPERVIWLPRAAGPVEHLRQYGLVDVALDCFPNGGCTTTCEALWMGTPVITLSGDAYVSRMSTAVLHGANLPQWCAPSELAYLELARAQADQLVWLRQNRSHWRSQLQSSPLGDAADLMHHLEAAFSDLAAASR